MTPLLEPRADGVDVRVHASPRSRKDSVKGMHGDQLAVAVTAPPEDGKANAAVLAVIARFFRLKLSAVALVSGAASREKKVRLIGVTADVVRERLKELSKPMDRDGRS